MLLTALSFCIALSASLLVSRTANALTIDEFTDGGFANAAYVDDSVVQASKSITSSTAVGGKRVLLITRTSTPNGGGANIYSNTKLFHNQDGGVRALSVVTWDGDSSATNAVVPNGLGDINFYQDTVSRNIIIQISSFDFANQKPADVTLRLYDSTNITGQKYTDVTVTLDRVIQDFPLVIPFSTFDTFGGGTVAAPLDTTKPNPSSFVTFTVFGNSNSVSNKTDLHHVGAIQLYINGQNGDSDLSLDFIKTDGSCAIVPNSSGFVVDACGLCLSDSNAAFPAGKVDDCGVCKFGPTGSSYVYTPVADACGVCPSAGNYNNSKDPCGVCVNKGGNGSSCADCSGTPNGGKTLDVCGVCAGNGSSCLDCKGVPFGTTISDTCGICGGNGTSCLPCQTLNVEATADACVEAARDQYILNTDGLNSINSNEKKLKDTLKKTNKNLYNDVVKKLNAVAPSIKSCASQFCVQGKINVDVLTLQKKARDQFYTIAKQINASLKKPLTGKCKGTPKECLDRVKNRGKVQRTFIKVAKKVYDESVQCAAGIPTTESVCS